MFGRSIPLLSLGGLVCLSGFFFILVAASSNDGSTATPLTVPTSVDNQQSTTTTTTASLSVDEDVAQGEYVSFIKRFSKKYTYDEFFPRYKVFKNNLHLIKQHNSDSTQTYRLGVNEYADLTMDEWRKRTGYRADLSHHVPSSNHPQRVNNSAAKFHTETLPASLDWRSSGKVTSVKNQVEPCLASWTFSAVGAVESAWAIAGNTLVSLSAQQLLDCDFNSAGLVEPFLDIHDRCDGGTMESAFEYLKIDYGLATDSQYPYYGAQSTCSPPASNQRVTKISSYYFTTYQDEAALMAQVAIAPVAVALETARTSIHLYAAGVYSNSQCGTNLDYGALVVGWGTDSTTNQDYWIIKYSWGTSWGESGYLRLLRNVNLCGVSEAALYPVL